MKYRIKFESVSILAHPDVYSSEKPNMPTNKVPENYWHETIRESYDKEDILDQAKGCVELMSKGELIRNIVVEQQEETSWIRLKI